MECNREDLFSFVWKYLVRCIQNTVPGLGLLHNNKTAKLERTGQKITKMVRRLMCRVYKERLREMGDFSPKERCLRRDFTAVFNHLMGGDRSRFSLDVHSEM